MTERLKAPGCYMLEVRTPLGLYVRVEVADIMAALTPSGDLVADHFRCEALAKLIRQGHPDARDTVLRDAKAALAAAQLNYEFLQRAEERDDMPHNVLLDQAAKAKVKDADIVRRIEVKLDLEEANLVLRALKTSALDTGMIDDEERQMSLEIIEKIFDLLRPMGSACR